MSFVLLIVIVDSHLGTFSKMARRRKVISMDLPRQSQEKPNRKEIRNLRIHDLLSSREVPNPHGKPSQ
jgi:hypothetical protein